VGDRTELESMTAVFERARPGSCALGSVKSQIGHTKCAAGIASLIKVALCLERGVLPPTLHIHAPNPGWRSDKSPFYFLDRAQPWTQAERVAGVSAFGFGGTNFHAVLASHRGLEEAAPLGRWPVELFLVHGTDRAAARRRLDVLARRVADEHPWDLAALARATCAAGAGEPVQLAFVARDLGDLAAKLAAARGADAEGSGPELFVAPEESRPRPKVAFLFPGQGSQRVGMLAELFVAFPMLRPWLESGLRAAERVYVPRSFSKQEAAAREEALKDTRAAQPALGLVDIAMFRVLRALGVEADVLGGHSYGELAALCAAEAIRPEDLLALSQRRAEEILRAAGDDPGGMAAVSACAEDVERVLEGEQDIVLANLNAPRQTVISGPTPPEPRNKTDRNEKADAEA
jgi:acyl transferase domain-containing protein